MSFVPGAHLNVDPYTPKGKYGLYENQEPLVIFSCGVIFHDNKHSHSYAISGEPLHTLIRFLLGSNDRVGPLRVGPRGRTSTTPTSVLRSVIALTCAGQGNNIKKE